MASSVNVGTLSSILELKNAYSAEFEKFKTQAKEVSDRLTKLENSFKKTDSEVKKNKDNAEKIEKEYRKVAAALDPVVKNNQKYEAAQKALNAALQKGIITQAQYNTQLGQAKSKYLDAANGSSRLTGILNSAGSQLLSQITTYIGITAAIGAIVSISKQFIQANVEAEASAHRVDEAVRRYGERSGITAEQINNIAQSTSHLTGLDDELIADAEAIGLKFNRIGSDIFPRYTQAAIDLSVSTGTDMASAFEKAGKLVNQPLRALTLFAKEGYAVGRSQSDLIKSLVASGDIELAQVEILKILEGQYGGAAVAARDTLGGAFTALGTSWENLLEKFGEGHISPIRSAIESLISLIDSITDSIDEAAAGWIGLGQIVNKTLIAVYGAEAGLREKLGADAKGLRATIEELKKSVTTGDFELLKISYKRGDLKIPEELARFLGLIEETHKKGTGAAKEQTEAESKLGDAARKAYESVQQSIDEYLRKVSNLRQSYVAAQIGVKAYSAELLRQKVSEAILKEENKLREVGGKLTQVQKNTIAAAVIEEDKLNKSLKETLRRQEANLKVLLTATDNIAIKGFDADFKRFIDNAHRGMDLIQIDADEMLTGLQKIRDLDLDVEFNSRLMDVEPNLRKVEADYLSFMENLGSGFEQEGENAIEAGERILTTIGTRFGKTVDEIKANLQLLADIDLASEFKDSVRPNAGLKNLRETLARLQVQTDKTGKALLSAAEAQKIYTKALAEVVVETLGAASNLLTQIGEITHSSGLVKAGGILGAAGGAVGASNTYSQNPSMMAFMGAAGAWLSLFITIAETFTKKGGIHYGADIKSSGVGSLSVTDDFTYVKGGLHEAQKAAKEVADTIENIVLSFGGQLQSITQFGIIQTGEGWAVSFGGDMRRYFQSFQDAVAWAAHEAISTADITGVSDEILEAFRKYTFRTLEDLQEFSNYAREYTSYGASELTGNLRSLTEWFLESSRKAYEYGLSIAKVSDEFGRRAQSWRDQVLGITRSPQEQVHQNVVDFNNWIEEQRRSAQIQIDAAKAQMAAAQVQMAAAWGVLKAAGMDKDPEMMKLFLEAQQAFKDAGARLEMWTKALENLPSLITPEEEEEAKKKAGKGGGKNSQRQGVRDWIEDKKFELNTRGLDEWAKRAADISRQYDQQLEQAGKDKKLRGELIALKERELQLLAQEQMAAVKSSYEDFIGGDNPFQQVKDTAQTLIDSITNSPFGDPEKAAMIGNVMAEVQAQIEELSLQSAASLFGSLISDMEKYGATENDLAQYRQQLAIIEHTLKVAHYRAEFAILQANGTLSAEILTMLGNAIEFVASVDPTQFMNIPAVNANEQFSSSVENTTSELDKLRESFKQAKDNINETVRKFDRGGFGAVTPEKSWDAALSQWNEMARKARGGDLEALQSASSVFDDTLDVLKKFSPALFATMAPMLRNELADLGQLTTIKQDNLVITDFEKRQQHKEVVGVLNNGFEALTSVSGEQAATLKRILTEQENATAANQELKTRLVRLESGNYGKREVG